MEAMRGERHRFGENHASPPPPCSGGVMQDTWVSVLNRCGRSALEADAPLDFETQFGLRTFAPPLDETPILELESQL